MSWNCAAHNPCERVRHVWHVEPLGETLEIFRLEDGRWVQTGAWRGSVTVRAEPFDAVELSLGALWAD